ncbi:MAG: CDP-alcohol phosphatidyltransferase family protein [Myxococcales bacterium]|nr:CDP-alcohol phosphatidyltransferase family protein [Myxococcales bacterium]
MTAEVRYEDTLKPQAVETPLDLLFFRPAAFALVKALLPTSVTPNQVTVASIVTGLAGAALSASERRDARVLGAFLGLAYGVLDCADGQLARARGTSSRTGRILDGASDYVTGVATGVAISRALSRKLGPRGAWLGVAGMASIVAQGTLFDHAKNRYLSRVRHAYREGDDLEETLAELERTKAEGGPLVDVALLEVYAVFLKVQAALASPSRDDAQKGPLDAAAHERFAEVARAWAYLGPSTHVALLFAATVLDRVELYVWVRLTLGNAAALWLRRELQKVDAR